MKTALKSLIYAAEVWSRLPSTRPPSARPTLRQSFYPMSARKALGRDLCEQIIETRTPQISVLESLTPQTHSGHATVTAAIGLPVMPKRQVEEVVVLICQVSEGSASAVELWSPNATGNLALQDGVYSDSAFEQASRRTRFSVLEGLPGRAFDARNPVLFETLSLERGFVRANAAAKAGLETGLGIPILEGDTAKSAALLLSSAAAPFAQAAEVWTLHENKIQLESTFHAEHLSARFSGFGLEIATQIARECAPTVLPLQDGVHYGALAQGGLEVIVGIPIFVRGQVASVVVLAN